MTHILLQQNARSKKIPCDIIMLRPLPTYPLNIHKKSCISLSDKLMEEDVPQ